MNRRFLFLSKIALAICVFYGVKTFCHQKTDGFTIQAITSSRPNNVAFEVRPLQPFEEKEVSLALNQPYSYLACGGQAFVFISADHQYVIKFFKQNVLTVPLWLRYFPIPGVLDKYKAKKTWKRDDKIKRDFSSYKISFEELQNETEVLFVHLNKTNHINHKLTIIDKIKIEHHIDLDQTEFVLQRKAELVCDRISRLMHLGQEEKAKDSITAILDLMVYRSQKGYHDRDPDIVTNCGFLGDKAIKIDVGRLLKSDRFKDRQVMTQEIKQVTRSFSLWLNARYPQLAQHLNEQITLIEKAPH